nr:MAG TPA: hypothetical protein [Caudoviricetes sp.]
MAVNIRVITIPMNKPNTKLSYHFSNVGFSYSDLMFNLIV